MAGNVGEWTNYCNDAGACAVRGDSFADYNGDVTLLGRCDSVTFRQAWAAEDGLGLRCCADAIGGSEGADD